MRAVIQRVLSASVTVEGEEISSVEKGLLCFLGVEKGDTEKDTDYIIRKIAALRVFEDQTGKSNLSVTDVGGEVLLVSQFTLCGDARKGRRPDFFSAAEPDIAEAMYLDACVRLGALVPVKRGRFRADMKIAAVNDGPYTILLDSQKRF